jgi:hypothetical protein
MHRGHIFQYINTAAFELESLECLKLSLEFGIVKLLISTIFFTVS